MGEEGGGLKKGGKTMTKQPRFNFVLLLKLKTTWEQVHCPSSSADPTDSGSGGDDSALHKPRPSINFKPSL